MEVKIGLIKIVDDGRQCYKTEVANYLNNETLYFYKGNLNLW